LCDEVTPDGHEGFVEIWASIRCWWAEVGNYVRAVLSGMNAVLVFIRLPLAGSRSESLGEPVRRADEGCFCADFVGALLFALAECLFVEGGGCAVAGRGELGDDWIYRGVGGGVVEKGLGDIVVGEEGEGVVGEVSAIGFCYYILGNEAWSFVGVVLQDVSFTTVLF